VVDKGDRMEEKERFNIWKDLKYTRSLYKKISSESESMADFCGNYLVVIRFVE